MLAVSLLVHAALLLLLQAPQHATLIPSPLRVQLTLMATHSPAPAVSADVAHASVAAQRVRPAPLSTIVATLEYPAATVTTTPQVMAAVTPPLNTPLLIASTAPLAASAPPSPAVLPTPDLAIWLTEQLAQHFDYPALARKRNWQGEVRLTLRVAADGRIQEARVAHSSGYALLDDAALTTLQRIGQLPFSGTVPPEGVVADIPVIYRLGEG